MSKHVNTASAKERYEESKHKKNYKSFYQIVFKRFVDILLCIIISPLILLATIPISIAIKIEDGGPIFYKSCRLGKDWREFNMLKFRSMKVNSPDFRNEDGSTYNSPEDTRMTRVGRFLREKSLDEIPQFFNVLAGHMCILGPRPGDVESKDTYEEDEKDKLLVKPGISGYTQAYYRNSISVREKRLYDAWYTHNVSPWLDVKILFKTAATVLKKDNLYTNSHSLRPEPKEPIVIGTDKK